jgi:hypothetical protein
MSANFKQRVRGINHGFLDQRRLGSAFGGQDEGTLRAVGAVSHRQRAADRA